MSNQSKADGSTTCPITLSLSAWTVTTSAPPLSSHCALTMWRQRHLRGRSPLQLPNLLVWIARPLRFNIAVYEKPRLPHRISPGVREGLVISLPTFAGWPACPTEAATICRATIGSSHFSVGTLTGFDTIRYRGAPSTTICGCGGEQTLTTTTKRTVTTPSTSWSATLRCNLLRTYALTTSLTPCILLTKKCCNQQPSH